MAKISAFESVTLDGFYAGPNGEIDWFKSLKRDDEHEAYKHANAKSESVLVFGRSTYEMMQSYWPTPEARKIDPEMARVVNESTKIVFSRTLKRVEEGAHWKNTRILPRIERNEVLRLKEDLGKEWTILGSGSIVQQFVELGILDEYAIQLVPLALGAGKPLFGKAAEMKLVDSKSFKNGVLSLRYRTTS